MSKAERKARKARRVARVNRLLGAGQDIRETLIRSEFDRWGVTDAITGAVSALAPRPCLPVIPASDTAADIVAAVLAAGETGQDLTIVIETRRGTDD